MAKIEIYAHAAKFSSSPAGFRCMAYAPFDPPLHRERLELRNVAEVEAAKALAADVIKAKFPGVSFFVGAMLVRGERSPNGFKKLRRLEYDAELVALVDDAVGALVAAHKLDPEKAMPLPEPVVDGASYMVVGLPGGPLRLSGDQLFPALEIRGHKHSGFSKSRALRKELQGRPQFAGLAGPMYDGVDPFGLPVVRYETYEANAALSI